MLQLKQIDHGVAQMMPLIGNLWERNLFLDGVIVCQDGSVPFSRLVLAAHSMLLREMLEDDVDVILLKDFSLGTVSGLIGVLHGSSIPLQTKKTEELKDLLEMLCLSVQQEQIKSPVQQGQIKSSTPKTRGKNLDDEDGVIITFSKQERNVGLSVEDEKDISQTTEESKHRTKSHLTVKSEFSNFDDTLDIFEKELEDIDGTVDCDKTSSILVQTIPTIKESDCVNKQPVRKSNRKRKVDEIKNTPLKKSKQKNDGKMLKKSKNVSQKIHVDKNDGKEAKEKPEVKEGVICATDLTEGDDKNDDEDLTFAEGKDESLFKMQKMYHTASKAVFMPEEKARKIISSYIIFDRVMDSEEETVDLQLGCSLCGFQHESEIEVYEHVALKHLKIFQYTCDFCSKKFKIKRLLIEHLVEQHGVEGQPHEPTENSIEDIQDDDELLSIQEFMNNSENIVEDPLEEKQDPDENVSNSFLSNQLHHSPSAIGLTDTSSGTVIRRRGAKKEQLFVGNATVPLLCKSKATLEKIKNGQLVSKADADQTISGHFIHDATTNTFSCNLCSGKVRKSKFYMIQRHLYDHFHLYFFQCKKCNDMFRNRTQYQEHLQAHDRQMEKGNKDSEKKHANHMKDKIGDYHLKEDFTFIPREEAREVIESYYTFTEEDGGYFSYYCKLCDYKNARSSVVYNHVLRIHLQIHQYKCDICQEGFKVVDDIKKHYSVKHKKKYNNLDRKTERVASENENYENKETEVFVDDITQIPMSELYGKKISTEQGRQLKGRHLIQNEENNHFECELCDFKKEWKSTVQAHIFTEHYNVFTHRCPREDCKALVRSWTGFMVHERIHTRTAKKEVAKPKVSLTIDSEHHLLTSPLFLGEEEGMRVAKTYVYYDDVTKKNKCKMCKYSGKLQLVSMHVLAKHLNQVYLFRCNFCSKEFRYSRLRFKEHLLLHTEGKLKCEFCGPSEKVFTRESLKAHVKRIHAEGEFKCTVPYCAFIAQTKAHLRNHEQEVHLIGIPSKHVSHICDLCDYAFPTRTRLKKHIPLCERGTSRTGFRKQISDCLQWLGKGGYRCNFCLVEFHPAPGDDVTATGLPEARNHVATVHGMKHMRKAKMTWHGAPKHVDKTTIYKDKRDFYQAKLRDIDRSRVGIGKMEYVEEGEGSVLVDIVEGVDHVDDGQSVILSVVGQDGTMEERQVLVEHPSQYPEEHSSQYQEEHPSQYQEEHSSRYQEEHSSRYQEEHPSQYQEEHSSQYQEEHPCQYQEEHSSQYEKEEEVLMEHPSQYQEEGQFVEEKFAHGDMVEQCVVLDGMEGVMVDQDMVEGVLVEQDMVDNSIANMEFVTEVGGLHVVDNVAAMEFVETFKK